MSFHIDWIDQDSSNEEKLLRQTVRRFVNEIVNPLAKEVEKDHLGVRRKLVTKAGELGILGLAIPGEFGGQGASVVLEGIAREELGRSQVIGFDNPYPLHRSSYTAFGNSCPKYLVDKWMPRFLKGESLLGPMSTEPRSGSDVAGITTTATKVGDKYLLNGEKGPLSFMHTKDAFFVLARTGTKDEFLRGPSPNPRLKNGERNTWQ